MKLRNRVIRANIMPDGKEYYILAFKPTESDPLKGICLLNPNETEPNYSLWNAEILEGEKFRLWPYKGDDSEELIDELLDDFVEHAHEVL